MATQANVARLLDTPGFKVIDCKTEGDLLWVELRGHKRRRPVCSGCGQPAPPSAIHDRKLRTVRDLACFGRRTYLRIEIVRVACPVCGVRVERLGFLHSNARYSRRFAYQVARLCLAGLLGGRGCSDLLGRGAGAARERLGGRAQAARAPGGPALDRGRREVVAPRPPLLHGGQ